MLSWFVTRLMLKCEVALPFLGILWWSDRNTVDRIVVLRTRKYLHRRSYVDDLKSEEEFYYGLGE
jgi:hypothetical protein